MKLFDVYPRFNLNLTRASGVYVYDDNGQAYLDLYGGHGVISIGHQHPYYVQQLTQQLTQIGFYSNSVNLPLQDVLAQKLCKQSGYTDYALFLCNSGAEANENALKLASFHTRKRNVIAFRNSFHGRTAAALNVTDNPAISSPLNRDNFSVEFIELNDEENLYRLLASEDFCAVIVEGIQGVGGVDQPSESYLAFLHKQCKKYGALLILDEIQSGYGRSGKFFAHQHAQIKADIITIAKGMGNGFPIGGLLIHPKIQASYGLLGTTFGGNPLACAAGLAVLDILEQENLLAHVEAISAQLRMDLATIPQIEQIKGKGLMIGLALDQPVKALRQKLLYQYHIFTGASANPNILRILPPLCITYEELTPFIQALRNELA